MNLFKFQIGVLHLSSFVGKRLRDEIHEKIVGIKETSM